MKDTEYQSQRIRLNLASSRVCGLGLDPDPKSHDTAMVQV